MLTRKYRVITINTEYEVPFGGKIEDSPESARIIEDHLNEMGEDGWELVGFLPALPQNQNWKRTIANPWVYHVIFKAHKDDDSR
jgi:hypothetical protein